MRCFASSSTAAVIALTGASSLAHASSAGELPPALLVELAGLSGLSGACVVADDADFISDNGGCMDLSSGLVWGQGSATAGSTLPSTATWDLAVAACESSLDGGYDDWFLPSLDELAEVQAHGASTHLNIVGGNFTHWSSTVRGSQRAWRIRLDDGTESVVLKSSRLVFVCARIAGASNPPAAPTNLTFTGVSSSQIDLAWNDNASNELGFQIDRSLDGVSFALLSTTPADTTSFADLGLAPATTYWYRVKAFNGTGDSAYSNITSATTTGGTGGPAVANGEISVWGETTSGDFVSTHVDDGSSEALEEERTGGPPWQRTSLLEHKWTFSVQDGTGITVQASHDSSEEDFEFAWSLTDDNDYALIGTVTSSSEQTLTTTFPSPVSGTVYVRVVDTDRTLGSGVQDQVFVDFVSITTD